MSEVYSKIAEAIKVRLQNVSGIGIIHTYPRAARSDKELQEYYVPSGSKKINAVEIARVKIDSNWATNQQIEDIHQYKLILWYSWDDKNKSYVEFQHLIDRIRAEFNHTPVLQVEDKEMYIYKPIPAPSIIADERAGILLHYAELDLFITNWR